MQWKKFGPDEATWEMADHMWLCILPYSLVEQMFWYMFFLYVFGTRFLYMFLVHVLVTFGICTYVYGCKYTHELCYNSPISGMDVMEL